MALQPMPALVLVFCEQNVEGRGAAEIKVIQNIGALVSDLFANCDEQNRATVDTAPWKESYDQPR